MTLEIGVAVPQQRRGIATRFDWEALAAALRASPGEWGRLTDVSVSLGGQIRSGKVAALRPPQDWEVTQRRDEYAEGLPANRTTLYIRYAKGGV